MTGNRLGRAAVALSLVLGALVGGCGEDPKKPATGEAGPTSPPVRPVQWTASHILIRYKGARGAGPEVVRSKEAARTVAESIRVDAKGGRSFDELVNQYTEDRNREGKVQPVGGKPGTMSFGPGEMVPEFEKVVKETAVGEVAPV